MIIAYEGEISSDKNEILKNYLTIYYLTKCPIMYLR